MGWTESRAVMNDRPDVLNGRLLLTRAEVAHALRTEESTVNNLHACGKLKAVRVGRENRWKPADVVAFVAQLEPLKQDVDLTGIG